MYRESITERLLTRKGLNNFKEKLINRLSSRKLIFNNNIQLTFLNVAGIIESILTDNDNFSECEYCHELYHNTELKEVQHDIICESCIDESYRYCDNCNDYVYNEDIKILNDNIYCNECYFKEKQIEYNNHVIINELLKNLNEKNHDINNLEKIEFKIDGNYWRIERYTGKNYRIGSWSANCWLDIGDNAKSLIKAIDYNLGKNRDKLTDIIERGYDE